MTILLNTKIKSAKKDSNPSSGSTGKSNLGSTGLWDDCPGLDAPFKSNEYYFCPAGEILCRDIKREYTDPKFLYCHEIHPKDCPSFDDYIL